MSDYDYIGGYDAVDYEVMVMITVVRLGIRQMYIILNVSKYV